MFLIGFIPFTYSYAPISYGYTGSYCPLNAFRSDLYCKNESIYCSCVRTARLHGLNLPPGDAIDLKANATPVVGGGILFTYPHVAVITSLTEEGIYIIEGNKTPCELTERIVSWDDPNIRGFVSY